MQAVSETGQLIYQSCRTRVETLIFFNFSLFGFKNLPRALDFYKRFPFDEDEFREFFCHENIP